jgi:hypothetical protein
MQRKTNYLKNCGNNNNKNHKIDEQSFGRAKVATFAFKFYVVSMLWWKTYSTFGQNKAMLIFNGQLNKSQVNNINYISSQ